MKKASAIVLTSVLGVGALFLGIGLFTMFEDPSSIYQYDHKTIIENTAVTALEIESTSDDITFYDSSDENLRIEYEQSSNNEYSYSMNNGVAVFKLVSRPNFNFRFFSHGKSPIKIYVPDSLDDYIDINLSSGDLEIRKLFLTFENLSISSSSGDIIISDLDMENADIQTTSGDIELRKCVTDNKLSLQATSGDIEAYDIDANGIDINVTSGDISLVVSGVPDYYQVQANVSSGDISINGDGVNEYDDKSLKWGNGSRHINFNATSGDFDMTFLN